MKTKITVVLLFLAANLMTAQADLGSISGKYFAADGLEFENMMKMKKKQKEDIEIKFVGEENGKIENKLVLKWKGGDLQAFLDEKLYNKKQTIMFKAGENTFIQLEEGVIAIADGRGERIGDVLAKDKNKLKDFDLDTAKALLDELMSDLKSSENDEALAKMMTSTTFKNNLDKVVFVDNKNVLYNAYGKVEYDEKKHIKTQIIGKPIWYNYYSKTNVAAKYGKTSEMNIEFEMEGVKKDRKSSAKLGRNWASSIPKVESPDRYMFLQGRSFCDPSQKYFDYAFLSLMSEMDGKLQIGKSYNLKVTIYVYKDGANLAKIAEGTIALKYEAESQKSMELWKEWIDQM